MKAAYSLTFDNQSTAWVVELASPDQLPHALERLHIPAPRAALVVVGGANGLTEEYMIKLETLFTETLCPFAEEQRLAIVDGGTDSGIMRLLGRARTKTRSTFPLLGVVVRKKTFLPGEAVNIGDAAPLEPNHTHFFLVPGQDWGDESIWIARTADRLACNLPSATLLINGGTIALYQDVPNSLGSHRPVLVVAGSGRAADQLAAALNDACSGGEQDPQISEMVNSGLIHTVAINGGRNLQSNLRRVFPVLKTPK